MFLIIALSTMLSTIGTGPVQYHTASASAAPAAVSTATPITNVHANTTKPAQYSKLEVTFDLGAAYRNPFDPNEVDAVAEITTPSGQVEVVPAFYASAASPNWTVRYSPRQKGKHELVIKVKDRNGVSISSNLKFEAKKPEDGRGFIGVSGDRFVDSYGNQFIPLGTNYAWGNPSDTLAAMPEYKASDMNMIRVWLTAWWANYAPEYGPASTTQNGITMTYDGIGKYNLDNMARMDTLIDTARANDLFVMLTLNSFGDFWYDWAYHAYNSDNGGPSTWKENATDFWYNPEAIAYQKQLLRYIFARWGYSTSLGMLEYWNESDNRVDTSADVRDSWHEALDDYWKSWDFYKHPTTTSFAWKDHAEQHATQQSWEGLNTLDVVNMHLYSEDSNVIDLWQSNLNALKPYGNRPVFIGEAGKTGNDVSTDAELLNYIHDGVWAPLFRAGAAGSNLWWTFESGFNMPLVYKEQYQHLAQFIQPEESVLINMPYIDYGVQSNAAKVGAYQNHSEALLWVNDTQSPYDNPNARIVPSMQVSIPNLDAGNYRVVYYDTYTGATINEQTLQATQQGLNLTLPSFSRDIAIKASKLGKPVKDKQAPSAPSQLGSTRQTEHLIKLNWNLAADNVGVTGYDVYRDGEQIGSVSGLTSNFTDTVLKPGTSYNYTIIARDAEGNESSASEKLLVSTKAEDKSAPASPGNLTKAASAVDTIGLTWSASTDNTGVTGYLVYRDEALIGRTNGTTLQFEDQGLRPGYTYSYTVKAEDAALNLSSASNVVTATTESPNMTDNLLENPGFETIEGATPADWTCEQSWYCSADTNEKKSGDASMRISGDTGAWFGIASAAVPAIAGNTYMLDSFAKVSANNGTSIKVRLQFLNAVNSILDDKIVKVINGTTNGYENIYGAFEAPANTTKVRVYIYIEGLNAVINLDDFSVKGYGQGVAEPTEPQGELLLNAGFDDHNDSWKTAMWSCEKEWLCQWTDQVKRSGTASMRVVTTDPQWFSVYQDALAAPGQTYTLDGFVQVNQTAAGGKLQVKLVFFDANDSQLSEEWIKDYEATTAGFENVHGTKTAPAGTAKVRVLCNVNGMTAEMYLDDFSLSAE